ncbi:hypothetical protein KD5_03570 [Yersinia pseudotuberculosis]|uniref:hypothetical protein n=1 Tax=Yersinia pseudotuberculosis complex TaxID=1649845 RepID=UPI00061B9CFF|nr:MULTISPECIES: hypothetical protein [Yersinia pseudotuberculosis complex]CNL66233.1 Uncharacterised protein [Yersinia pseudotuberculosis]
MKNLDKNFLTETLQLVLDAIELHKNKMPAPLSIDVLNSVRKELEEMIKVMDPQIYTPSYPRFIIDWPDDTGLIEKLVDVDYYYKKIKKNTK